MVLCCKDDGRAYTSNFSYFFVNVPWIITNFAKIINENLWNRTS